MSDISDEEAFAVLAAHALNELYVQEQCCPECCYPCDVLKQLSERGALNAILAHAPSELHHAAWSKGGAVDQEWLKGAWTRTDCHEEAG